MRVHSEGPHLGIASAEPKAGERLSRKAAILELVVSTVQRVIDR